MPYFTHGETKYKLILLYIIDRCSVMPTRDQLYRTAILNSKMEYFAFEQAMNDLEEDGMIASVRMPFGDCFGLTDTGREALAMFENSVPVNEREKLDSYLVENLAAFAHEREITSRIDRNPDGSAVLELMIVEHANPIFSVRLSVSSEEQAMEMRSRWENSSESIYNFIWDSLLNKRNQKNI